MITCDSTVKTAAGDCGRPYLLRGEPRPIVGIHSFLTDDDKLLGLTPCYYEDVKRTYDELRANTVPIVHEDAVLQYGPIHERHQRYWFSKMECLGEGRFGDTYLRYFVPTDSKFVRVQFRGSLVQHREWLCDFEPAAQRPSGGVHPLFTNMQKYATNEPISSVPHGLYVHCLAHYVDKLPESAMRRRLIWDEAINGVEGLQPLMMNTSSGFWTALGFKDGKHQFFDPLPQEYSANGELLPQRYEFSHKARTHVVPLFGKSFTERLEDMAQMTEEGIAPYTIWVSTVKDELRSRAKVEACKSRVFEQCGLDMTLLFRKEFGAFLSWFRSNYGFTLHSGIGADKEVVWGAYARVMRQNSPIGF